MSVKKSNSTKSRRYSPKKKEKGKGKKVFEQRIYIGPGSKFVKQPKG